GRGRAGARARRRVHATTSTTLSGDGRMSEQAKVNALTVYSTPLVGRVLVVDDHPQARESMADILRQAGHRVECVSSAVEALLLPSGWRTSSSAPSDTAG